MTRDMRRRWPLAAVTPALILLLAFAVVEQVGGDAAVESADPQIRGMAAEGATNAAYQAAYRSSMRRKGF